MGTWISTICPGAMHQVVLKGDRCGLSELDPYVPLPWFGGLAEVGVWLGLGGVFGVLKKGGSVVLLWVFFSLNF